MARDVSRVSCARISGGATAIDRVENRRCISRGDTFRYVSFCAESHATRCGASPDFVGTRIIPFFKLMGGLPLTSSGWLGTKPTLLPTRTRIGRGGCTGWMGLQLAPEQGSDVRGSTMAYWPLR